MVKSCCAFGCTQRWKTGSGISFHKFPFDNELRKQWLVAVKRENVSATEHTAICSKRFLPEDFVVNFGRKDLTASAIPSVFNFPEHLKKKHVARKPSRRLLFQSEQSTSQGLPVQVISPRSATKEGCSSSSIEADFIQEETSNIKTAPISLEVPQNPPMKRKRSPIQIGDFKVGDMDTPKRAKRFYYTAIKSIAQKKSVVKCLRKRNYRLLKKIKTLNDVITHLKESSRISDTCFSFLQESLPESQKQLMFKQLKFSTGRKYNEALRTFALTLNFYSSTAYNYKRKTFAKCLPHPKTLGKWYSAVDGSPGYTKESLRAIEIKAKEMEKNGQALICNLVMDEMSIREHIHWNGHRQIGYINCGLGIDSDSLPAAKEALVFLLVALNSRWKIPIAYFLINGLTSNERANLVKNCLEMTHSVGVKVTSITYDGAAANVSMATILGASLSINNLRTHFPQPITQEPVFIILDACHMIKLVRNTLGDWGTLLDKDNNPIKWDFFKALVNLQEDSGLHAGTKIRRRHINYQKEKMRVKLATQTFSDSVADALDYCCHDLKLDNFSQASATANFCRTLNNIFDVLNTRNALTKNVHKKSLSQYNRKFIKIFFEEAAAYIKGIKNAEGFGILSSSRKTGFLGLLIDLTSVEGILDYYVINKGYLQYILTYKLSQDHIEMFFSNIRSRGGFNNNPTALQFESAYKKLLLHTELSSSETANCLAQDETSILHVTSKSQKEKSEVASSCIDLIGDPEGPEETSSAPGIQFLTFGRFESDVVEYIAGFVAKKLCKSINCAICTNVLIQDSSFSLLLLRKNKGGLIKPSIDVVYICKIAEKVLRTNFSFSGKNVMIKLILSATRNINFSNIFNQLSDHILDQDPLNNHLIQLVYHILNAYFNVRIHHHNNTLNEVKDRIRQQYSKLIHFKHQ